MPEPIEAQLDGLYREIILDHFREPRNRGTLDHPDVESSGDNPLCGDVVTLQARVKDGVMTEVKFEGRGCSISQASSSILTEAMRGKRLEDVRALITAFKAMMLEGAAPPRDAGDVEVLQGVRQFAVRVKCATLAWNVLEQALNAAGRRTTSDGH